MTHEHVNEMLKAYRFEVGRCGHLTAEMAVKQRQLEAERASMVDLLASPKAQQITDMPRGTTVGNPTERAGLKLAAGYVTPEYDALQAELAALQSEYDERYDVVMHVTSWLGGLDERGRWVIEAQVIDSLTWREIISRYRQRFGEDASKDTLKRIRDRSMDKIYQMAQ